MFCREFNNKERKENLLFLLKQLNENPNFKIYLLKKDYSIRNIEFLYYENSALYVYDSSTGYGDSYFQAIIEAKPILDIFDDFVKNELLINQVYPENETIEYLNHLLSTLN